MTQIDLFGQPEAPVSDREAARRTYRLVHARDTTTLGCSSCGHAVWDRDYCRLARRAVDIDFGTCSQIQEKTS